MLKLISIPLSWIYSFFVSFRNLLFDWGILKSQEYDIPVVCVGNISAGGSGKTPHTELLVKLLSPYYNIAVLSRGYNRKSSGYYEVHTNSLVKKVGDEPKQIKLRYPNIVVVVCEDRRVGIKSLRRDHPEVNLVILDDGFQHRYVECWLNILLTDHALPYYEDKMLPWGRLRESRSAVSRAHIVIVTKAADTIKPIDMRLMSKSLNMYPYQSLFFTRMDQSKPMPLFPSSCIELPAKGCKVIAMCSIAKPDSFVKQLKKSYNVVDVLSFPDHYNYKKRDLASITSLLKQHGDEAFIFTTDKDAVKFAGNKNIPPQIRSKILTVPIAVNFVEADLSRSNTEEDFLSKIIPYVEKNQKYNTLNP